MPSAKAKALGKIDTWPHPVAGTLPSAKVQHSAKWTRGGNLSRGLCRVSDADPRQKFKLCRVPAVRHSAKRRTRVAPRSCFAECQGTRQKSVCRVPVIRHSAKSTLPWDPLPSVTLGKDFAEWNLSFAECNGHSAKFGSPVVQLLSGFLIDSV